MPVLFWGADGASKYYNSYFARFDGNTHLARLLQPS
jgi:hypothetical protein